MTNMKDDSHLGGGDAGDWPQVDAEAHLAGAAGAGVEGAAVVEEEESVLQEGGGGGHRGPRGGLPPARIAHPRPFLRFGVIPQGMSPVWYFHTPGSVGAVPTATSSAPSPPHVTGTRP